MNEVLRLYPPAYIMARRPWSLARSAATSFALGSTIIFSQWVMHRDPRYFDDPGRISSRALARRPDAIDCPRARISLWRRPASLHRPGIRAARGGHRHRDARAEFQFSLVPGHRVVPEPLVTLRPRHGIHMTLHARN